MPKKLQVILWMYQNDNGIVPRTQICDLLESRGFDVFHDFCMKECHVISGKVYSMCGRCLSDDDILFHMNADEYSDFSGDILKALEASGVKIINSCEAFFNCRDKFITNQKLRLSGVRVPDSIFFGPHIDARTLENVFRCWNSVLYKPRSAHGASGILRFNNAEQFLDFMQTTSGVFENYYLEKYIPFGEHDYRVEIFNGKCLGGYSRKKRHEFKTNISSGGEMIPGELGQHFSIALKCARVMNINGTIVDMVKSTEDGQFYVLEVNSTLGIFVESAMRAGTKMPDTIPDPAYCYDTLKVQAIVDYISLLGRTE